MTPAPFTARQCANAGGVSRRRADLERWAREGCKVSRLMLDTGMAFPEAVAQLQAQLGRPVPVHDLDPDEEWR